MRQSAKRYLKRSLWFLLIVFILMNGVAAFHAYKFTHFKTGAGKKKEAAEMNFGDKLSALFFGVDLPRPENKISPNVPYERVRINSNKQLDAWLIKVDKAKGTVIICHGYGGEKSSMLDKAYVFNQLGYNAMLVDFMGCGGSQGSQTTIGFQEAREVKDCLEWVQEKGMQNIILFGTSMGAAAIMKAMHDDTLKASGVILECPFGTMMETVKSRFRMIGVPAFPMAQLLMFWGGTMNGFNAFEHNPSDYAKTIGAPVLLIYGEKDLKVSAEETDRIYQNLPGRKKLLKLPLAGHENYLVKYRKKWTEAVHTFMDSL
jgi:alpha-beta hydrolase superfamily lysophospholipase